MSRLKNKYLIIGYGNQSRSDDGAGLKAAEKLREYTGQQENSHVKIKQEHQLMLENTEELYYADTVIFIDARRDKRGEDVIIEEIKQQDTENTPGLNSHFLTPGMLLRLCEKLYGYRPKAYLLTIKAQNFDYGFILSKTTEEAVNKAVGELAALLGLKR